MATLGSVVDCCAPWGICFKITSEIFKAHGVRVCFEGIRTSQNCVTPKKVAKEVCLGATSQLWMCLYRFSRFSGIVALLSQICALEEGCVAPIAPNKYPCMASSLPVEGLECCQNLSQLFIGHYCDSILSGGRGVGFRSGYETKTQDQVPCERAKGASPEGVA